jgi:hypothetical protein
VINLGVGGYDLHQYLTQSSTVVEQYGLDWLIMLFNSRNDYDRAMLKATYGAYRPFWVLEDGQLQQIALEEPFALQIFPVEFQDSFAEYNRYLSYEDTIQFSIDPDHPLASSWLYITTERWLWDVRPRSEPSQAEIDDFEFYISGWWKFEDPIPEPFASYQPTFEAIMSAWAQQANHTQVFILPDRREILWEEETEPLVAAAFERMGKAAPNPTVFLDWITQMDMPSYSFYDDMMAVDEPPALFLPGDSHLSPAGYRLIGEAACQQLQFAVD